MTDRWGGEKCLSDPDTGFKEVSGGFPAPETPEIAVLRMGGGGGGGTWDGRLAVSATWPVWEGSNKKGQFSSAPRVNRVR